MHGTAIWITGLPGSGKSTVADALNRIHPGFIILRIDDLRNVVTPEPTYSDAERDLVYRSLVYTARELTRVGHDVIIDATGNRRAWRDLARRLIPAFLEVYLRCPVETCAERERTRRDTHGAPRDIYRKGGEGAPVPGVNVPYEEPFNPDVVIDAETPPDKAAARIHALLDRPKP